MHIRSELFDRLFSRPLEAFRLIMFGAIVVSPVVFMPEGVIGAIGSISQTIVQTRKKVIGYKICKASK